MNPLARWAAARREAKQRLVKAAGISSATLVCHGATWSFIRLRSQFPVEHEPSPPTAGGLVRKQLSGPELVKILSEMRSVANWRMPDISVGDRAIAQRIYNAVAEVVDRVDPAVKIGAPIPDIVIDDKIGDES